MKNPRAPLKEDDIKKKGLIVRPGRRVIKYRDTCKPNTFFYFLWFGEIKEEVG